MVITSSKAYRRREKKLFLNSSGIKFWKALLFFRCFLKIIQISFDKLSTLRGAGKIKKQKSAESVDFSAVCSCPCAFAPSRIESSVVVRSSCYFSEAGLFAPFFQPSLYSSSRSRKSFRSSNIPGQGDPKIRPCEPSSWPWLCISCFVSGVFAMIHLLRCVA